MGKTVGEGKVVGKRFGILDRIVEGEVDLGLYMRVSRGEKNHFYFP